MVHHESDIWPALLHALESKILLEVRAGSIRHGDIIRLKAFDDNLGSVSVVCRMETFLPNSFSSSRAGPNNDFATDKRRIIWMIDTQTLKELMDTKDQETDPSQMSSAGEKESSRAQTRVFPHVRDILRGWSTIILQYH